MGDILTCAKVAVQTFPNQTVQTPQGAVSLPVLMVAIAGHESGWNAGAQGDYGLGSPACHGYTSFGYWQIHLPAWGSYLHQVTGSTNACTWANWLKVPANNARAAWYAWQQAARAFGAGWQPWSPDITGGVWTRYRAQAEAAVRAAGGAAPATPTPGGSRGSGSGSPAPSAGGSHSSGSSSPVPPSSGGAAPTPSGGPPTWIIVAAGGLALAALVAGGLSLAQSL